ncbi:SLAP domain-containing protein [Virgibacillus oceani]
MQKLLLEKAWEKTISETDRSRIMEAFHEAVLSDKPAVQFSPLWQAINHKGERLVTVIIHNISKETFSFVDKTVKYSVAAKTAAQNTFSLPFFVKGETSTPWTFIFPKTCIFFDHNLENGKLELVNSYDPD